MIRATPRTYWRSHVCAASFVRRGCQLMKYGKALSSQGGLIIRKPPFVSAILAKVRGTVRTRSVCAMAKTAEQKRNSYCNPPFYAECCQRPIHHGLMAIAGQDHRVRQLQILL
jgi:hypothetical protein